MEREEVLALLDVQRKCFNDAFDQFHWQFTPSLKDVDKKISDAIVSLEFTQSRLDDSIAGFNTIYQLKDETDNIKIHLEDTKTRLDYLDDQSRRNNLKFSGIPESYGENWEQCQAKVTKLLCAKMKMANVPLERVHRIGKPTDNKPRDIVAKFKAFSNRNAVYRGRRMLIGTHVFINVDLGPATLEARRRQLGALKEARDNGKIAFFNYRTLVVKEWIWNQRSTAPTYNFLTKQ